MSGRAEGIWYRLESAVRNEKSHSVWELNIEPTAKNYREKEKEEE